jgi:hypothetical protein
MRRRNLLGEKTKASPSDVEEGNAKTNEKNFVVACEKRCGFCSFPNVIVIFRLSWSIRLRVQRSNACETIRE